MRRWRGHWRVRGGRGRSGERQPPEWCVSVRDLLSADSPVYFICCAICGNRNIFLTGRTAQRIPAGASGCARSGDAAGRPAFSALHACGAQAPYTHHFSAALRRASVAESSPGLRAVLRATPTFASPPLLQTDIARRSAQSGLAGERIAAASLSAVSDIDDVGSERGWLGRAIGPSLQGQGPVRKRAGNLPFAQRRFRTNSA